MERLTVLIIDDETDLLEDSIRLFETYNIDATASCDYAEAVKLVTQRQFACVVLDLKMPPTADMPDQLVDGGRLTGIVVCGMLRKANPSVPILVLTSIGDQNAHVAVTRAGATELLRKPCHFDEIVQKIKRLARLRRGD